MGCVHGKGTNTSSPQRGGLDKLKLEYGYHVKRPKNGESLNLNNSVKGGGEAYHAVISVGGGGISQRMSVKNIAADEFIGGWPRWLVENVPKDALAGLVPKTADSYDKLAKVIMNFESLQI